jgi:hypothetical protein
MRQPSLVLSTCTAPTIRERLRPGYEFTSRRVRTLLPNCRRSLGDQPRSAGAARKPSEVPSTCDLNVAWRRRGNKRPLRPSEFSISLLARSAAARRRPLTDLAARPEFCLRRATAVMGSASPLCRWPKFPRLCGFFAAESAAHGQASSRTLSSSSAFHQSFAQRNPAGGPQPADSSLGLCFPSAHAGIEGPLTTGFACPLRSARRVWLPSRRFTPFEPGPALFRAGGAPGIHPSEPSPPTG